jgi:maltooligosyltrehalose trehalohydrolase
MEGERLSRLVPFDALKLAAGAVLLSPFVPLLFMGEEYAETAPFQYFTHHSDPELVEAVRRGRRHEFAAFGWPGEPPDPQAEETFLRSRLDHGRRESAHHRALWEFYRELLRLRRTRPALSSLRKDRMEVSELDREGMLVVRRWAADGEAVAVFHFGDAPRAATIPFPPGDWVKRLDAADERWAGPGATLPPQLTSAGEARATVGPYGFALYERSGGPTR